MRYAHVCETLARIAETHAACAREWRISDTLVMTVQLDLSGAMQVAPDQSERASRSARPIRITFFRTVGACVSSWQDRAAGTDGADFSDLEGSAVREFRVAIQGWVGGRVDALPASTSSFIADQLRRKR